jgi:hypothetical protein
VFLVHQQSLQCCELKIQGEARQGSEFVLERDWISFG